MVKLLEHRLNQLLFRLSSNEKNNSRLSQKVMKLGVQFLQADGAYLFMPEKWTRKLSLYEQYKAEDKRDLERAMQRLDVGFCSLSGRWTLEEGMLYVPLFVNNTLQAVICMVNVKLNLDPAANRLLDRIVEQVSLIFSNKKIQLDKDHFHDALVEISRVITQSDNFDEVITEAMQMTSEMAGGNCALMLLSKDGSYLKPSYGYNLDVVQLLKIPYPPLPGVDQTAYVSITNRRPVFVTDAFTDPMADNEFCRNNGIRSYMTLPLVIHEREIGVMYIDYKHLHEFTDYEVNFFKEVGYQLSHVVYSLLVRRELLETKDLQDRLINMMREMTNRTKLKDALGDVVLNTHKILGGKVGVSIWLLNDNRSSIKLAACRSDQTGLSRKKGIHFSFDHIGDAGSFHDLFMEVDPHSEFGQFFASTGVQCTIGTPLLAEKELQGILFLHAGKGHEWTETEKMILSSIGTHAGPIIRLAQYIRMLEMESKLDGLTKVFNRQYFDKTFREYINRHLRQEKPFSLLMIDLDNFKQINDRYGHVVGDEVMRSFAKVMLSTIRKSDKAFRYGGEEFVVLLPWTTREEAAQVAERLRENIEKGNIDPPITISVGLSTYLDSTKDHLRMLELADAALYKAKNRGKNQVVCAE